jgi:superfamily II DNA or RNA helicase
MSRPLHKKSSFFVKDGLFNKVNSYRDLEKRIEKLKDNQRRGDAFEVFVEAFLNTSDSFEAVKVYPSLAQTPAIIRDKLKVSKKDKGIDGVFLTKDEKIIPYQVKFRTGREVVDYGEITKFIHQSTNADIRYLIGNSNNVNEEYKKSKKTNLSVKGCDFDNLSKDQFQTAINWLKQKPPVFKPTKPDPKYQTKIIADTFEELRKADRATILMACASGKTLVSMWIAQKIVPKTIVIFVPSLALAQQFYDEWTREKPFKNILKKVICSKWGEQLDYDDEQLTQDDVPFKVDTDHLEVRRFLNLKFNGIKIIFCTYQSSRVLKDAMQKKHVIDLGIFDEAHRTTQYKKIIRKKKNKKPEVNWSLGLFDEHIKITKRLFMTATTKEIKKNQFLKDGDDKIVYAMNDKTLYGEQVCDFTFAQAREVGAICPYKILISVITKEDLDVYTIKNSNVLIDGEEISAEQFALQLAVKAAVKKFRPKKIFTFHHRCEAANSFVKKEKPEGIQRHLKDFYTGYVDGAMSMSDRTDIMSLFQDHDKSLVSNARCLVEGVNVPAVDMVVFVDPKKSKTDIAQAAGRAMRIRNLPNKIIGYVLIPLFLESFRGEKVKEASARSGFDEVISTLRGLAQFDDAIRDEMTLLKVNQLRGKGLNRIGGKLKNLNGEPKDPIIRIIGSSESVERVVGVELLNRSKKDHTWESYLAMLIEWKEKYKNFEIPLETKRPFIDLGEWVNGVRFRYRRGLLSEFRINQLNSISFRWSLDGETLDSIEGLMIEREFREKFNLTNLSKYRKLNLIKPVGFYHTFKLSAFYRPEQIDEFKKTHKITLLNTKGLLTKRKFIKKCGIANWFFNQCLENGDLVPRGIGLTQARASGKISVGPYFEEKQVKQFIKDFEITITDTQDLYTMNQLSELPNLTNAKKYIDNGWIKSEGKGFAFWQVQDLYKLPDMTKLNQKIGISLDNVDGLISESDLISKLKLKSLNNLRETGCLKPEGTYWSRNGKGTNVSYYYKPEEEESYYKKRKVTLRNTKGYISANELANIIGCSGVSTITDRMKDGTIESKGKGLDKGHLSNFFKKSAIKKLEKYYGGPFLKNTRGFLSEKEARNMEGMRNLKDFREKGLIKPIGVKFITAGATRFYKKQSVIELQKKRLVKKR